MKKIKQAARSEIMLKVLTATLLSLLFIIITFPVQAQRKSNLDALQILKDFRTAEFDPSVHFMTADDAIVPKAFNNFSDFSLGFEYEEIPQLYGVINRFEIKNLKREDVAIHAFVYNGKLNESGVEETEEIKVTVLTQKEIAVEYRESKKIRYTFTGKFLQSGSLMRFILKRTPVLEGTLQKYKRGKLVASTKIQYMVNVAFG